jgi:hypothetical protein
LTFDATWFAIRFVLLQRIELDFYYLCGASATQDAETAPHKVA